MFLVSKLWFTVNVVTLVNELTTVAVCAMSKLVSPEPSPEKIDAVNAPVPKLTSWLTNPATCCAEEEMIPAGILSNSV